jgi:hypothetical protein
VIRVDTHNIRSDDAVLGDWHWFKDIHLLLMVFFFNSIELLKSLRS